MRINILVWNISEGEENHAMLTSIRPFIVSSVDGAKKVSKNILLKISMKLSCRGCNGLNTSPLSERENVINCGQLE